MMDDFDVLGQITEVETIAVSRSIRDIVVLRELYGRGNWRKLKGVATVRLSSGTIHYAELHWYEAHGIGRRKLKIKRILE